MSSISILELDHNEARKFFLKHESYCNIDLPKYFSFTELLKEISIKVADNNLSDLGINFHEMKKLDDINHLLYANKDGKLSWRPLQIIHPLVYVDLVHHITKEDNWKKLQDRFKQFQSNSRITCLSIPVQSKTLQKDKAEQILIWWESIEQESIYLSLEYNYIFDTDVADCYGSIYTHSIAWAIETKSIAKQNRGNSLLGNAIDQKLQNAQYGQTNGVPQGSVLMDFIAEVVLGSIDELLTCKLADANIEEYRILRYRDDYKIFVNNSNDGEHILRILSEIMMPYGLKLNASKTRSSQDIITQSIKKDKLSWLKIENLSSKWQKRILLIRQHSIEYPNSGTIISELNEYDKDLEKDKKYFIYQSLEEYIIALNTSKKTQYNIAPIISIVCDIAYQNPKTIPICCSIISKLFLRIDNSENIKRAVYEKLIKMPNSGFAQIWMQRMLKSDLDSFTFSEKLCQLHSSNISLWNNSWINNREILDLLDNTPILQQNEFSQLDDTISNNEINIFNHYL